MGGEGHTSERLTLFRFLIVVAIHTRWSLPSISVIHVMFETTKRAKAADKNTNTIPATRKLLARLPDRMTLPPEKPVTVILRTQGRIATCKRFEFETLNPAQDPAGGSTLPCPPT